MAVGNLKRLARLTGGLLCAFVSMHAQADELDPAIQAVAISIEQINAITCPIRTTVGCPNPGPVQPPTVTNPIDLTGLQVVLGIGNINASTAIALGTPGPLIAALSGCQAKLDLFLQHTEYPGYLLDYEGCLNTFVPPAAVQVLPSAGPGVKFIAGLCILQTKAFAYDQYVPTYPYYQPHVKSTGVTDCSTVTTYMTTTVGSTTALQDFMRIYEAGRSWTSFAINKVSTFIDLVGTLNNLVGSGVGGSDIAKVFQQITIAPVMGPCGDFGCGVTWVTLPNKDVNTGSQTTCESDSTNMLRCKMNGIPMTDSTIARSPSVLY